MAAGEAKQMCSSCFENRTRKVDFMTKFFFVLLQVDASVSTEMATMTEPDSLGPMDPGSSVTLEGIVWNETENGKKIDENSNQDQFYE